jgi:hypothetical protein
MFGRLMVLAGLTLLVLLPTAAAAQEDNYPVTSTSTSRTCDPNDPSSAEVCGTVVTVSQGGATLPFTGGDVALLTVLGLGAAGAGIGLVWFGRRSEATSDSTA